LLFKCGAVWVSIARVLSVLVRTEFSGLDQSDRCRAFSGKLLLGFC
jgi:hypothetical protein